MKTKQEIKEELLKQNPSRFYTINDVQYEQTEEEFLDAVERKAEMVYQQELKAAELLTAE